ncbi:hypothetical protein PHMEG_00013944 [Phytophthora megakarya]|uniref:HTH CENPB-type domain-containing protein n=1 Tax=Phytophthora megakarya TaxID=4795 RepID=A0A225W5I7_9STRA|nr:hypothetical protein PHMEG_00013944 [Phytophthora megakarya]
MPGSRVAKTMGEKKEVVAWIDKHGGNPVKAAGYFQKERGWKISAAQIRYWWKQKESIKSAPVSSLRLKGAGAKPRLAEVEDMIFDQVLFLRSEKKKVSRDFIAKMGKDLAQSELHDNDFVGSNKWVDGFMRRYDLSLRRTTNLTILTDDILTDRALSYMQYLSPRIDMLNLVHTVLMDETAVYFEDPRRQTVDATGARHVVLKSTGFASMRVTAVLAVTASGRKLPPLVVWKGARQDGTFGKIGNSYVTYQERAWVDSQLLIKWLDLIFPAVLDTSTPRKAVVWDSMRAHISKAAGDIGIYKNFKDKLSTIIDEWKASDRVLYTKGGNPKKPPAEDVVAWVQAAWQSVPDAVVSNSVAAAGFSPCFEDWHISRHDVYGEMFCRKWLSRDEDSDDDEEVVEDLLENLDEFTIWDANTSE